MEEVKQSVHKVTLSTGKIVLIRPMKIKYQHLALQAIGSKAGDNSALMGSMMQDELLKMLIVNVDGKNLDKTIVEDLDNVFAYDEYVQVTSFVQQLMGGQSLGKFKTEFVNI